MIAEHDARMATIDRIVTATVRLIREACKDDVFAMAPRVHGLIGWELSQYRSAM